MFRFLICAAFVLVLAAGCSSGSGDVETADDLRSKVESYSAGQPTLDMTAGEVEDAISARSTKMTHDLDGELDPCYDDDCGFDIDRIRADIIAGELTMVPVLEHNGVRVSKLESSGFVYKVVGDEDETSTHTMHDYAAYAGWLDYSLFAVVGAIGCEGLNCLLTDSYGFTSVSVVGVPSQANPLGTGSATWTGLMIGMRDGEKDYLANGRVDDTLYAGDARITIDDLANPDVDVFFTGIRSDKGDSVPDMSWQDLPVMDGVFPVVTHTPMPGEPAMPSEPTDEYIEGMFTGPSHQEVVGSFNRIGIIGAFGAKR